MATEVSVHGVTKTNERLHSQFRRSPRGRLNQRNKRPYQEDRNQAHSFGQGYNNEQLNPNNPDNYQDYNADGRPQYNSCSNQERDDYSYNPDNVGNTIQMQRDTLDNNRVMEDTIRD